MMNRAFLISLLLLLSCKTSDLPSDRHPDPSSVSPAKITAVSVSGTSNAYSFSVTINSPDTGCDQYADWWEVLTPDGTLLYRRILTHSHVNEQPFTRSGGPVQINENTEVIIRAHMNKLGYGSIAYKGIISSGFVKTELSDGFASELEKESPLPDSCAF